MVGKWNSYTQVANAYTEEAHKEIMRSFWGNEFSEKNTYELSIVAVQSECLYRAISLIAYGNGWGCLRDIDYFTTINPEDFDTLKVLSENISIKVTLPYHEFLTDGTFHTDLGIPKEFKQQFVSIFARRESTAREDYHTFTLNIDGVREKKEVPELVRLLGELIVNYFAPKSYLGTFDGKPEFKDEEECDTPWLPLSQVKRGSAPRLCPACGKVVERSMGKAGGKPPVACCQKHIDAYHNEQKRLHKTADDNNDMAFDSNIKTKAREMRWQGNNNARPYTFPGIKDIQEDGSGSSSAK